MNMTEFHQLAEQLVLDIEQRVDAYIEKTDADIDYESQSNVMTITFENKSKIIINTQEPLYQMWMATRKQGYHFDYVNQDWIYDRDGRSFMQILDESMAEQAE